MSALYRDIEYSAGLPIIAHIAWQYGFSTRGPMSENDGYGEALGRRLNARAASYVSRSLRNSTVAVTELKYQNPQFVLSTPPLPEDAFMVGHYLSHCPKYAYWENGRAAPVSAILPGQTIIYDLKRRPTFEQNHAFHTVHFYLSRACLDEIADEASAPRIDELRYRPAVAHDDPVIRRLSSALLPFFGKPEEAAGLFFDHVMLAIGAHVASRYGGMRAAMQGSKGGLSPWQESRAKEMLSARLTNDGSLAMIASECKLSPRHFTRAFRQSVGVAPHRWLMEYRVNAAKSLLPDARVPLAQVAIECGFADQSHFTRVFTAITGSSPGAWRRSALM